MVALSLQRGRLLTGADARGRFVASLRALLGETRLLWLPRAGDGLATVSESDARRVVTHAATPQGRLAPLGRGLALSFNGTTDRATVPDADALSFGTGTADSAFSVVVVANVTDTAALRALVCKWNDASVKREWIFYVLTTDLLQFQVRDESAVVSPVRVSDAAITQGSWRVFGATYSGAGGATAADGITLYEHGVVKASTATNNASYVAMENTAGDLEIGAFAAGASGPFSGSLALVAVVAKALTAADHAAISAHCRTYFGI